MHTQRGVSTQGSPMAMVSIRRGIAASPEKVAARESSSDETLIRRIAGGDQLAMRTLFVRHRVALYRWLLRLVGDETLAEDLLSEAFLSVWRQAHRFEGRSSVSTWLLAIARNKALSTRRSRTDAGLDEESISIVPDTAVDPEVALLKKNRAELLRQSIARLSPETPDRQQASLDALSPLTAVTFDCRHHRFLRSRLRHPPTPGRASAPISGAPAVRLAP